MAKGSGISGKSNIISRPKKTQQGDGHHSHFPRTSRNKAPKKKSRGQGS